MNCPNIEILERYFKNSLGEDEYMSTDDHVSECEKCLSKINAFKKNDSSLNIFNEHQFPTVSHTLNGLSSHQSSISVFQAQKILKDQYKIVKKVGQGASGDVFQAIDTALERTVAIKIFCEKPQLKNLCKDQWQEGKFMGQLNHPHIAHIYHIGENNDKRYIVMEWIDGVPITQAWNNEPLAKQLSLYLQLLEAIDAAHKKGVIHRDIKPSNILVSTSGEVKVLDFGIAMGVSYGNPIVHNIYCGTPSYSAPEQITCPDKINTATDVFALGVLLYQLLTSNNLPFSQLDTKELFEAICNQNPELPSAIQEKVPLPLQNICLKALEKNLSERYPDAQALKLDICRYLRGEKVWSRPSFVDQQIEQEIFYHRQRLDVWHHNGILTEREHDKLERIYERVIAPVDLSIIESRKLSFSQVCLYLGGWITVLGCTVLILIENWDNIPKVVRPLPALVPVLLIFLCGRYLWKKKETRLSTGFLATSCLLFPVAILLLFGHYHIFSPTKEIYSLGTESFFSPPSEGNPLPEFFIGNLQILITTSLWMLVSLLFLRIIRSSIFVIFCILSFLGILTTVYIINGMIEGDTWRDDIIAGRYLYPGVIFFIFGMILDRKKLTKYAWPLSGAGIIFIVGCLSYIALSDATLLGWLYPGSKDWPSWYEKTVMAIFENDKEMKAMSFFLNGIIYFILAWTCRHLSTPLHRSIGQIFYWLGPIHILGAIQTSDKLVNGDTRQMFYRVALPIASLCFIFGSVPRQMKSFLFSGLFGFAAAVFKFTDEYFDNVFYWPITLIIIGVLFMLLSWWIPHWKATKALRQKLQF